MTFAPFDVVVVPFPYSDRLAEKRRPALVVSSQALGERGWIWVAMITSVMHDQGLGDWRIGDLTASGLPVASLVRGGKLATIEPGRIVRRAGRLSPADIDGVSRALNQCAAFGPSAS